jgi:hypothetical protein
MAKRIWLAVLSASLLAGVFAGPAAAAEPAQKYIVPVDYYFIFNTCTGEWVDFTGSVMIITRDVFEDGDWHYVNVVLSPLLTAVGRTTGEEYLVREALQQTIVNLEDSIVHDTATETITLRSLGSTDDFTFLFKVIFTVDANGIVRVDTVESEPGVCRG